jgi:hypothetical protein
MLRARDWLTCGCALSLAFALIGPLLYVCLRPRDEQPVRVVAPKRPRDEDLYPTPPKPVKLTWKPGSPLPERVRVTGFIPAHSGLRPRHVLLTTENFSPGEARRLHDSGLLEPVPDDTHLSFETDPHPAPRAPEVPIPPGFAAALPGLEAGMSPEEVRSRAGPPDREQQFGKEGPLPHALIWYYGPYQVIFQYGELERINRY